MNTKTQETSCGRRNFLVGAGISLISASYGLHASAATSPTDADILAPVHPELQGPLKEALPYLKQLPTISAETLAQMRAPTPYDRGPLAAPTYTERTIPGRGGAPDVRIFIINASRKVTALRPAILYMHGGAYVVMNAFGTIADLQEISQELDCIAISVDYRLAPETPFPGPMEDNYAALKWVHDHAEELGVDRCRIAVMGDSAGGGHAAALAIAARDRGEVPIIHQSLGYPMLDDRTLHAPNLAEVSRLMFGVESNRFGWTSYLGVPAGSARVPKGAVPAREQDLRHLPPAYIGIGSLDLFLEESMEYAQRLLAADVPTELLVIPGGFHSFEFFREANVSRRFVAERMAALRSAFDTAA